MTPPSSLARASGEGSFNRVAGIAAAPLLPGEQEPDYANLVARIVAVAQPSDAIEDLLTRDVIDLTWEIFRLRRVKAGILKASINTGIVRVLDDLVMGPRSLLTTRKSSPRNGQPGTKTLEKKSRLCSTKRG